MQNKISNCESFVSLFLFLSNFAACGADPKEFCPRLLLMEFVVAHHKLLERLPVGFFCIPKIIIASSGKKHTEIPCTIFYDCCPTTTEFFVLLRLVVHMEHGSNQREQNSADGENDTDVEGVAMHCHVCIFVCLGVGDNDRNHSSTNAICNIGLHRQH